MPEKVFIHATNVHQGGGRSLLDALLKVIDCEVDFVLLVDARMPIPKNMAHNVKIKRVKPSVVQRFKAERWLVQSVAPEDIVLCFGNLPPMFKLRGHTVVFVQNRYLIDEVKLKGFSLKARLKLAIERLWLSSKMTNTGEFIVQTPTMKRLLGKITRGRVPVRVIPFVAEVGSYARGYQKVIGKEVVDYDFVYVASGEPHKNHQQLIEAWCLLAKENLFPSLCLTLDEGRFSGVCQHLELMRQRHKINVVNAGSLSHSDAFALYGRSGALIYPSLFESFGLPLIEAAQSGLPILASELDYVRDIIDPDQVFDPNSPTSISRAVKRFMGIEEATLNILNASDFLEKLIKRK